MLLCPQCQFENPDKNKFCQKCGTSLTHKTCHQCDRPVQFTEETCQECGTIVGPIWWAVILKSSQPATPIAETQPYVVVSEASPLTLEPMSIVEPTAEDEAAQAGSENIEPSLTTEPITEQSVATATSNQASAESDYLDSQKRYRILEPITLQPNTGSNATDEEQLQCTKVLDTQPFQETVLQALKLQKQRQSANLAANNLTINLDIPVMADIYLTLKSQFSSAIPEIHDAWEQDSQVLLLEDRSQWQMLHTLWASDQVPLLQIVYWLDEILKLWVALEPYKCRQSLLEPDNLRVDEDEKLSLQRLYPEPKESAIGLVDLGQVWQILFDQSQRTQFNSLYQLFRDLSSGTIATSEELRSRLTEIRDQLQAQEESAASSGQLPEPPSIPYPMSLQKTDVDITETDADDSDDLPTVILPMQLISLEDAGYTDIGRQRDHNEDCYGIETRSHKQENPKSKTLQARGLYVLCDGMGGHASGEVASAMAVQTLKDYFQIHWKDELPKQETIREAILQANKAIYATNEQNARFGSGRMGTTLVMMLIQDTKVAIAHVGDSRIYRISRKRGLEQITLDHEVGQREINRGVEPGIAYSRPDAYQLTQALGPRDENFINPDIHFFELNEDTLLLLSSDGLSDNDLLETHWQNQLLPYLSSKTSLEQGVIQLIDLANQHNGHDNITAVLVRAKVRPNMEQH